MINAPIILWPPGTGPGYFEACTLEFGNNWYFECPPEVIYYWQTQGYANGACCWY